MPNVCTAFGLSRVEPESGEGTTARVAAWIRERATER
jgi:hypothetical protein